MVLVLKSDLMLLVIPDFLIIIDLQVPITILIDRVLGGVMVADRVSTLYLLVHFAFVLIKVR